MGKIFYSVVGIIALFIVSGCANAGKDKVVLFGETVTLEGNASTTNVGGEITEYHWLQIVGPNVDLNSSNSMNPTFTAPSETEGNQKLIFKLITVETGGDPKRFISFDFVKISLKASHENNDTNTTQDTEAPTLTLNGDDNITIKLNEKYTDAGATANDNVDGNITKNIKVVNPVDTNKTGTYTVTYNVKDKAGNEAEELTRQVNVIKKTGN